MSRRHRRSQRGFALVLTLWVLSALSILLLTFSMQVRTNVRAASYLRDQAQAEELARGAIERMALALAETDVSADTVSSDDESEQEPEAEVGVEVERRLGTWVLDAEDWRVLSRPAAGARVAERPAAGETPIRCEVLAEEALLPLDRIWGPIAEELRLPVGEGFALADDLLALRAQPHARIDEIIDELYPLVTTFTRGQVFVNAASADILSRVPGLDRRTARALAERVRRQGPFTRLSEVGDVVGVISTEMGSLEDWLTLEARFFRVRPEVDGARIEGVVEIDGDRARVVHVARRPAS